MHFVGLKKFSNESTCVPGLDFRSLANLDTDTLQGKANIL